MFGVVLDVVQGVTTHHAQTRERQNRRMNVRDEDVPGYLRYTEKQENEYRNLSDKRPLCKLVYMLYIY